MAGLLDLFQDDKTTLGRRLYASGHSRKNAGDSIEVEFVNYNVVGAAQELFTNISANKKSSNSACLSLNFIIA